MSSKMFVHRKRGWEIAESNATPEDLFDGRRRFVKSLSAGPILLAAIGLTGTKTELHAVARAYKVETKLLSEIGDKQPIYAHGSFIFLMKPDGLSGKACAFLAIFLDEPNS